jgi:AraC-like DNA-binding protein
MIEIASEKIRVFAFRTLKDRLCIDFTWHTVAPGILYVVPAGHRIYVSEFLQADAVCYEMDEDAIPSEVQEKLFRLRFAPQKSVPLVSDEIIEEPISLHSAVMATLTIIDGPASLAHEVKAASIRRYQDIALAFTSLLKQGRPTQRLSVATDLAASLHHHERTVRRACLETFGLTPAAIMRYYLTMGAVRMLAETSDRLELISRLLEFSDYSKCSRFLKGQMGISPAYFRRQILSLD